LAQALAAIAEHEITVEHNRTSLAELSYFAPHEAFTRMDRLDRRELTEEEI
jgi:hypothetical protein